MIKRAPRHIRNPYLEPIQTRKHTIYCPDEYTINLMCSLTADALRLLCVMAAKIDPATGSSHCPKSYLRQFLARHSSNLQRVTSELIKHDLVARAAQAETYYINPKAFRPVSIDF